MYPLSCLLGLPIVSWKLLFPRNIVVDKTSGRQWPPPLLSWRNEMYQNETYKSFTWKPYDTERHNAGEVEWERVRYAHSRVLGKPRLCESVSSARYYRLHNPEILLAISISTWVNQRKITTAISKLEQSAPFSKADMLTKNLRFSQLLVSCGV